jgi:hypothetical protein
MVWGTKNAYKNAGKPYEPLKEDARIEMTPEGPFVVMVMITGSRHTESVQLWCPLFPTDGRTRVMSVSYVSRPDFIFITGGQPLPSEFQACHLRPQLVSVFGYCKPPVHPVINSAIHRITVVILAQLQPFQAECVSNLDTLAATCSISIYPSNESCPVQRSEVQTCIN